MILTAGLITTPVYCNKILLIVKVGSDDDCLFQDTPTGSVVPSTWSVEPAQMATGASLGLGDGNYAAIKFYTLDANAYEIDYPLQLTLTGRVGAGPGGRFPVVVQEHSGAASTAMAARRGTVGVVSDTAPFYLANFVATAVGRPILPTTDFANGATVILSWDSNGDRYALWRKMETAPFWTGSETTCSFTGPTNDTPYFLVATSNDPDVTGPLYDTITITIANPDLASRTARISTKLWSQSVTQLDGGATITGGDVTVSGGTLHAKAGAIIDPAPDSRLALSVNGGANIGGLWGATVNGGATINPAPGSSHALSVNGGAAVNGDLSAAGPVSLFGKAGVIDPKPGVAYPAATDGFLMGFVNNPGDLGLNSLGYLFLENSDGVVASCTGGNMTARYADQESNNGSAMLPVRRGATYNVSIFVPDGFQCPPITIWWMPLGASL
ncbi:MAG: hypothetical protein ABWX67_00920 [Allosphingosinicella sp.]